MSTSCCASLQRPLALGSDDGTCRPPSSSPTTTASASCSATPRADGHAVLAAGQTEAPSCSPTRSTSCSSTSSCRARRHRSSRGSRRRRNRSRPCDHDLGGRRDQASSTASRPVPRTISRSVQSRDPPCEDQRETDKEAKTTTRAGEVHDVFSGPEHVVDDVLERTDIRPPARRREQRRHRDVHRPRGFTAFSENRPQSS